MAEDFGAVAANLGLTTIKFLGIGLIVIVVLGLAIWASVFFYKKKKWNMSLTLKLPRSNGKLILTERAKGFWDATNGWIVIKRKGYKKVTSRPIDPKEWLSGKDQATLIQVGPEDFIIAREDSYSIVKDSVTGKEVALMDIIADVGKRKTWKNYTERMGKGVFTLSDWAKRHEVAITIAIVIFIMFLGFAVLWMRMPSICAV